MRVAVPTGLVTFLFTDIEGSSQRWETRREAMQLALRRHDRLMRAAIERHNGRVFKTMGDQFCAVFWSAPEAAAAALGAQTEIAAQDWSAIDGLHVRMALHTGVTDERDGDYFGPAVNRVARLLSIGHGDQILLSGFAADLVREQLPAQGALRNLGEHRLKDLAASEHVFELVTGESVRTSPKLRELGAPTNLPAQLTTLVGREREIAAIEHLLERARLLTLTGSGGVGKTSTALYVAGELANRYDDGAWFVELASISDPQLVASAIAAVFAVEDTAGSITCVENLIAELRDKRALIVLDNCEHVIDEAAAAAEKLLRSCPGIAILATSREALHVEGEQTYRLPSLAVPAAGSVDAKTAASFAAVELFAERARAVAHDFELTDANAAAVAEIVRRLDGIALAIELAAACVEILTVEQLAAQLDQRFMLLSRGKRTALPRQQTLRALIGWSYDLLDERERAFLRGLAVFRDGWTLDSARAVGQCRSADPNEAYRLLSKLTDKSLVVVDREGDEPRYRLLESTREYALERLEECGERDGTSARHCAYF
jgi:predicted ATPase/class 3 adenylate cyclase